MSIKLRIAWLVAILFCTVPLMSSACTIPPPHLSEPHTELVLSAKAIVLAKVVGIKDEESGDSATFIFEPVETLKGVSPANFELYGFKASGATASESGMGGEDFEGHSSPLFWAWGLGNSVMLSTCSAYGVFEVGESYLVFLRDNPHLRAYENIREEDDLWLAVIRLVAENYGDSVIGDFAPMPESESLAQCIDEVVSNDEYRFVRRMSIDACIERHGNE